jgi:hypothetical protein
MDLAARGDPRGWVIARMSVAKRTHIWRRFRGAMMMFWQPLILLAVIPTIITLASSLPFVVNLFLVIGPLFGVAAYLAYTRYGMRGLVSIGSVLLLGFFFKLLNLISATGQIAPKTPLVRSNQADGSSGSFIVLIAMIILFGAAAYFAGRLYGDVRVFTIIVVFIIIGLTLGSIG